jgi:hypothetical protein
MTNVEQIVEQGGNDLQQEHSLGGPIELGWHGCAIHE